MKDFLHRLGLRTLNQLPVVQPLVAPRFAENYVTHSENGEESLEILSSPENPQESRQQPSPPELPNTPKVRTPLVGNNHVSPPDNLKRSDENPYSEFDNTVVSYKSDLSKHGQPAEREVTDAKPDAQNKVMILENTVAEDIKITDEAKTNSNLPTRSRLDPKRDYFVNTELPKQTREDYLKSFDKNILDTYSPKDIIYQQQEQVIAHDSDENGHLLVPKIKKALGNTTESARRVELANNTPRENNSKTLPPIVELGNIQEHSIDSNGRHNAKTLVPTRTEAAFPATAAVEDNVRVDRWLSKPTIQVNIGRIEVRAVTKPVIQEPVRPRPSTPKEPALSLHEYLKQRSEGRQ